MVTNRRLALFVEGSTGIPRARMTASFDIIWGDLLVNFLGLPTFDRIIPIDKKMFVAMRPETPVSGRGVPLDIKIAKELDENPFDVAVIAWDLQPPWSDESGRCRWNETLMLYQDLSRAGTSLSGEWKERAEARHENLRTRPVPGDRQALQSLETGEILAVCMVPMFESLLTVCERTVRDILGVNESGKIGWPRWRSGEQRPDDLIDKSLKAARKVKPTPTALSRVPGGMDNAKNEWGEYLLRHMIASEDCRTKLQGHPISVRLRELLVR